MKKFFILLITVFLFIFASKSVVAGGPWNGLFSQLPESVQEKLEQEKTKKLIKYIAIRPELENKAVKMLKEKQQDYTADSTQDILLRYLLMIIEKEKEENKDSFDYQKKGTFIEAYNYIYGVKLIYPIELQEEVKKISFLTYLKDAQKYEKKNYRFAAMNLGNNILNFQSLLDNPEITTIEKCNNKITCVYKQDGKLYGTYMRGNYGTLPARQVFYVHENIVLLYEESSSLENPKLQEIDQKGINILSQITVESLIDKEEQIQNKKHLIDAKEEFMRYGQENNGFE